MFEQRSIGIVVPAYNEEQLIVRTLTTMPDFVDVVIVVNDGSSDDTAGAVQRCAESDPRVVLIDHAVNRGLGQTLIDGYLRALEMEIDVIAVMAGDAQMAPDDLPAVVGPVARGEVDYVKGNRLLRDDVSARMPTHRFFGNNVLTLLTKFATGYWRIIDPQCGYTAISRVALATIPIQDMIKGYGYNAHVLHMLNLSNFKVRDVEVQPVYDDQQSKIKLGSYARTVSALLTRLFLRRILVKHALREFHPLVFFYFFGAVNILLAAFMGARFLWWYFVMGETANTTLIIFSFTLNTALLNLFFAMWMDMEENRKLEG